MFQLKHVILLDNNINYIGVLGIEITFLLLYELYPAVLSHVYS